MYKSLISIHHSVLCTGLRDHRHRIWSGPVQDFYQDSATCELILPLSFKHSGHGENHGSSHQPHHHHHHGRDLWDGGTLAHGSW